MNAIEYTARHVRDEVADAEHYAQKAIEYKTAMPDLAETLYSLSGQELEHARRLYDSIKSADGRDVLDYEYSYLREAEQKVHALWEQYKG